MTFTNNICGSAISHYIFPPHNLCPSGLISIVFRLFGLVLRVRKNSSKDLSFTNMGESQRRFPTIASFLLFLYAAQMVAQELCGTVESNEVNSTCVQKGYQMYDWETEICCNGTIYPWSDTTFCCGSELFDTTSQMCCDDEVYDQAYSGQLLGCCYSWESDESTPYDLDNELCCEGLVFSFPTDESDSEQTTETTETTDSSKLEPEVQVQERRRRRRNVTFDGDDSYLDYASTEDGSSSESEYEEWSSPASSFGCCKNLIYDVTTHVCCDDRIQAKGGNMACCGQDFYDSHTERCCESLVEADDGWRMEYAVLPIDHSRPACCGLTAIDYTTEFCCDDGPVPLPEDVDANTPIYCCGKQLITDDELQFCCGDEVHLRWPQSTTTFTDYNATDGNHIVTITDHSTPGGHRAKHQRSATTTSATTAMFEVELDCCKDKVYDVDAFICCDDVLYPTETLNDNMECCWNTGTLYNVKTQLCCYPEVLEAPPVPEGAGVGSAEKTYCCIPDHEYYNRKK